MNRIQSLAVAAAAIAALSASLPAVSQTRFPERPITIVVPFGPGTITDTAARLVAADMRETLGQPVIIDNKGGAEGRIGAEFVARVAKPDGYTLLVGSNSINATQKSLYKQLPYDPDTAFAPVGLIGDVLAVIVARQDLPVSTLAELVQYGKANPGKLSFAYGNTTGQVSGSSFAQKAGLKMVGVAYKGEPNAITDLMGGQVDLMFANLSVPYPFIKSGKVKALGMPGGARIASLPDVPPANETVSDYLVPAGWIALFAPASTPPEIIATLNAALTKALNVPATREKLESSGGFVVRTTTPQGLKELVQRDSEIWARLLREAGIAPQ